MLYQNSIYFYKAWKYENPKIRLAPCDKVPEFILDGVKHGYLFMNWNCLIICFDGRTWNPAKCGDWIVKDGSHFLVFNEIEFNKNFKTS